jgi:uncharacterized protein (DUF2126 family)
MSIRVGLHHRSTYRYDRLVSLSPQSIRLRPAPHCRTPIQSYSLRVSPEPHFLNWQQDPFGNFLARVAFPDPTRQFEVNVDLVAEMTIINPFDFFLEPGVTEFPFQYDPPLLQDLQPYLQTVPLTEPLQAFLAELPHSAKGTVDYLVALNGHLSRRIRYVIRLEPGVQSCEETLARGSGSCRDSAWLLAQVLRHQGLAARFVSGYLIQLAPDAKSLDGPSGTDSDFTDLHAWTEAYLPGAGWVGLDPTSGLLAGEGHIPLSATPLPESAAPITGAVDPCDVAFEVEMKVTRLLEDPRVTKPYSDEQWSRIEALGSAVDARLAAGPQSLTMGGEPTFVSVDHRDAPEWNTTAQGPHKRKLAGALFGRLAERFAIGPLLHYGQGKWYPGEQLPRWALGCYWRKDRSPVWKEPALIAVDDRNYGVNEHDAHDFLYALAELLGVTGDHIQAGYEDAWYYLWRERRLPVNVDPFQSQLKDPEERARLARVFERGLDRVVGYALPLRAARQAAGTSRWETGPWFLRPERMYLIPGDSPMGFRLPLDSLPWIVPDDIESDHERDPLSEREPLPARDELLELPQYVGVVESRLFAASRANLEVESVRLVPQYAGVVARELRSRGGGNGRQGSPTNGRDAPVDWTPPFSPPGSNELAPHLVRTALCVEARQGVLRVFMPPVGLAEDYLHLVSVIELAADKLSLPVRIEGYPPPYDYRLDHFQVTPDPGVIEVNLQPAASWSQLVHNTSVLYEEAHQCRLSAEKFLLDGRHTGTGGGNHVVIGGATPAQSPFLKRPDLLRSLLGYWNNRPSLSYLLSGLFIGPTSQAPRVDEARHESLHELEIAFAQIPDDGPCPPWLVDRVFRHLLVDVTGNTHRAEFCIDKLYSPDTANGRLGLVEFRGLEMPPHARMSLTQQLLLRALIAKFWERPYRQPLVRWGTMLHDRFLLPHFVAQDFAEMIEDLNAAGFAFEAEWFLPHYEFRFPKIGEVTYRSVNLELRQAIEPWNVLGEEPVGASTARFVDSSVERLQVKVSGLVDGRYVLACNGRAVPLHPTGIGGEYVAGVRFRAWQPPSCLHPTIGIHTPLVFDLIDTWSGKSIGGCTWHVAHPGGRNFETFPVNAYEAESRRAARFWPFGHTPGPMTIPPLEQNRDYPFTLDLRRPAESCCDAAALTR